MTIEELIKQKIEQFRYIKAPTNLERFVLEHGNHYPLIGNATAKKEAKQCFKNAADTALNSRGFMYVEGLATSATMPHFLIHHAWCVDINGMVFDPTWNDPHQSQYYGVPFETNAVRDYVLSSGYYCLLDTGRGLNMSLMQSMGFKPEDCMA